MKKSNEIENKILNITKEVLKTNDVEILFRLPGGMSNYTYVVNANNKKYVVRIPGEYASLFINRKEEKENLLRIEKLGIVPETIYFDLDSGIKISEFIEGAPLSDAQLNEETLQKVAKTLQILHQSEIIASSDYDYFALMNTLEKQIERIDKRYFKLKKTLENYIYITEEYPKVFCHGDTQLSNFIVSDSDDVYLVDYEFSGNAPLYFDLSIFGFLGFNRALSLGEVYFGRELTKKEVFLLHLFRLQQYLQWYTVARIKSEKELSKKLHIPFAYYASEYIKLSKYHEKELLKIAEELKIPSKCTVS